MAIKNGKKDNSKISKSKVSLFEKQVVRARTSICNYRHCIQYLLCHYTRHNIDRYISFRWRKNYSFQGNYCKEPLRATKKSYFDNLDISKIKDIRSFSKAVVLLFSKKNSKRKKNLTWLKNVKMFQKMLNCVVFSIIIFQELLLIWKYQLW